MSINTTLYTIFKKGSTTYFYTSLFFPAEVKKDIFTLYSFVRTADNLVDCIPQKKEAFYDFKEKYAAALKGTKANDIVIDSFVALEKRKKFNPRWTQSFFSSMEMDLEPTQYRTLKETQAYMHGSAEVIGLYMSTILGLPKKAHASARMLGRSMQYMNFIRDIAEDTAMHRCYFPQSDLIQCGLTGLDEISTRKNPKAFEVFINLQLTRYTMWNHAAIKGFNFIPKKYRAPIMTASEMYTWTGNEIQKNPFVIYSKKVKPSVKRIALAIAKNSILPKEVTTHD